MQLVNFLTIPVITVDQVRVRARTHVLLGHVEMVRLVRIREKRIDVSVLKGSKEIIAVRLSPCLCFPIFLRKVFR